MEEVYGAEEAPRRAGLHAQEPVQKNGGVPTFPTGAGFWSVGFLDSRRLAESWLFVGLTS